ncbi:MAG: hypothetical protein ABJO67_02310 [Pseudoruegeria sp.]
MTDQKQKYECQFFSASDLSDRISRARDRELAHNIVEDARTDADSKRKEAERDAVRQRALMQSAAKRKISKEMEQTRRKATTIAVQEVMSSAAKVHKKFDALSPWIEDLVETSLRKILGTIPDPIVLQSIVTQAISQNRRELKYILRAGNDVYTPALKLVEDLEETVFRGLILDVEIDRKLDANSIILTSPDGALDISLETQLSAVRAELAAVLKQ